MVEGEVCVAFLGPREIQKRMTFGVVMGLATVVRGCCWCSHLPVRPHQHDTGTAPGWSITTDAARSR